MPIDTQSLQQIADVLQTAALSNQSVNVDDSGKVSTSNKAGAFYHKDLIRSVVKAAALEGADALVVASFAQKIGSPETRSRGFTDDFIKASEQMLAPPRVFSHNPPQTPARQESMKTSLEQRLQSDSLPKMTLVKQADDSDYVDVDSVLSSRANSVKNKVADERDFRANHAGWRGVPTEEVPPPVPQHAGPPEVPDRSHSLPDFKPTVFNPDYKEEYVDIQALMASVRRGPLPLRPDEAPRQQAEQAVRHPNNQEDYATIDDELADYLYGPSVSPNSSLEQSSALEHSYAVLEGGTAEELGNALEQSLVENKPIEKSWLTRLITNVFKLEGRQVFTMLREAVARGLNSSLSDTSGQATIHAQAYMDAIREVEEDLSPVPRERLNAFSISPAREEAFNA